MTRLFIVPISIIFCHQVLAGQYDSIDQLSKTYGNINMNLEFTQVPVEVLYGSVPLEIEGTFARHGCGIFGYSTRFEGDRLDRIKHVFDCIEIAQSFSFLDGQAFFTSKFYDTARNDILRDQYDQDLYESSVFWHTTFPEFNESQVERHRPDFHNSNKTHSVQHVSWWTMGAEVIAMDEGPGGHIVDPHNGKFQRGIGYLPNWELPGLEGLDLSYEFNPAHQGYDKNLGVISSTGVYAYNKTTKSRKIARIVYSVKEEKKAKLLGQINYNQLTNWEEDCKTTAGVPLKSRLRYMHTMATTEKYIVIPESSSMRNPCKADRPYLVGVEYEPSEKGRFHVIPKHSENPIILDIEDENSKSTFVADHHFFITHLFNAFEEDDLIHVDVLMYDDEAYSDVNVLNVVFHDNDIKNHIMRYSLNLTSGDVASYELFPQEDGYVEFNNINPKFIQKPYRYGYAVKNVFRRNNAIVKFDFKTKTSLKYELPNGEFGTEPIFYPNGPEEDDGYILVNTLNGELERSEILILWAKNMKPQFKGRAAVNGLQGLHSAFFPFDIGCLSESCKPDIESRSTKIGISFFVLALNGMLM